MFVLVSGVVKMIIIFSWTMGDRFFGHGHVSPLCFFFVGRFLLRRSRCSTMWKVIYTILSLGYEVLSKCWTWLLSKISWLVVSFYFHPYLGKIPNLTFIFFKGVGSTTNKISFWNHDPTHLWLMIHILRGRTTGLRKIWFEKDEKGHSFSKPLKSCIIDPQNV